ncbi:unnamed protein product [Paramecium sonneborni]|uniref:Adenylosuccinate synthetase n=1 Tax=Paramecium sonneborni TaxID=65129 RepID=A0A8S1KL53_9CILI|nr:unnamed protein product [Paramecium sonneborni]
MSKCVNGLKSRLTAIIGAQWGDEGKGKLVDILAEKYDFCARFNGGANAGHTIVVGGVKYAFHLLPCGILYQTCMNVIGNGVVVNIPTMFEELAQLDKNKVDYTGRLVISNRAHLVVDGLLEADAKSESDSRKKFLGTTKRGIGPTYSAKALRQGLRVGDLLLWDTFLLKYHALNAKLREQEGIQIDTQKEINTLKEYRDILVNKNMIVDTISLISNARKDGKRILAEGANATMLDIDYGTYPYVTSSSTNVGGVCTGLGIPPSAIETVIGIVKAYTTRVGEGPFPTELTNETGKYLQKTGHEFGATTGRPRRCGWLDIPILRYSIQINGHSSINLTKLDILTGLEEIKIGVNYLLNGKVIDYIPAQLEDLAQVQVEYMTLKGWKQDISDCKIFSDLPIEAQNYVKKIEELLGIPVSWIGNGPQREKIILKD